MEGYRGDGKARGLAERRDDYCRFRQAQAAGINGVCIMGNIELSSSLRSAAAPNGCGIHIEAGTLDLLDSAVHAMTDFRQESPISVPPNRSIDEALSDMKRLGIHALLVTEVRGDDIHEHIRGLITSYRIERCRMDARRLPEQLRGCGNARVGEIMTPWDELALVNYHSLQYLNVSEVARMFQGSGLTHVVVVETRDDNSLIARGLISRSAVAKRLQEWDGACTD
jgi:CBS domain-containing protein